MKAASLAALEIRSSHLQEGQMGLRLATKYQIWEALQSQEVSGPRPTYLCGEYDQHQMFWSPE